jgi:hypothetical protein
MKKLLLSICVFAFSIQINAQTPNLTWAKGIGGSLSDVGTSIVTDLNGNVYTTGYYSGTIDFDPSLNSYTLSSNAGIDFYISKLDASGNFVWAKSIGGINNDFAYGITLDPIGNVIVTGYFAGTVDFDPNAGVTNLNSALANGIFVLKLDALGNFIWAKAMYGNSYGNGLAVKTDDIGNIYTTGLYSGTIDFDPGPAVTNLTVVGSSDFFVSKLDAAGNFVWVKSAGGSGIESGNDIKIDAAGNIYTTGYFNGTVDFDPGPGTFTLSSQGVNDIYITKWNSSGSFLWTVALGGAANDNGKSIDVDALGNVYTTGTYYGIVDFDPSIATYTLASNGNSDCFILKLNSSGNFLWAKTIGNANLDYGHALILDATKNIYTCGSFQGNVDFDPGPSSFTLASATSNNSDAFISKLDSLGNYVWAVAFGGSASDLSNAITIDASFKVYNCGSFGATADMDPLASTYTLISAGSTDAFIHKMSQCIAPANPTNTTAINNLNICSGNTTQLSVSSTSTVNWYASSNSTISIGTGTNYITPLLSAGTYSYYAEASTCTTSATRTEITVTVNICTGISNTNFDNKTIKVYPNPTQGVLTFDLESLKEPFSVEVINAQGERTAIGEINNLKNSINIQTLANGIYFLRVKQGNNYQQIKFIKQ